MILLFLDLKIKEKERERKENTWGFMFKIACQESFGFFSSCYVKLPFHKCVTITGHSFLSYLGQGEQCRLSLTKGKCGKKILFLNAVVR